MGKCNTYMAHSVLCLSNMQMRSATNLIKTYYAFFKYIFEDNWIYNQMNLKGSDFNIFYANNLIIIQKYYKIT